MPESSLEREKRILAAAADLFAHYGYDKTTVDEIARESGVSKGAIYLHFKGKEDLFEVLLLRESDKITERFFDLLNASPDGATLYNIYRYGLVVLDASPLLKAVYTRDRRVLGDYVRRLRDTATYRETVGLTTEFIQHYQAAGLIRADLDAETLMYLLSALRYGVLTMDDFLPDGRRPSVEQLGETVAEMLTYGLAPRIGEGHPEVGRQALEKIDGGSIRFLEERQSQPR